jgi:hypothetical protein
MSTGSIPVSHRSPKQFERMFLQEIDGWSPEQRNSYQLCQQRRCAKEGSEP